MKNLEQTRDMLSNFALYPDEEPFHFRKSLDQIHLPDRCNPQRGKKTDEFAITAEWKIIIPLDASKFLENAALDLRDYFQVSMNLTIEIKKGTCTSGPQINLQKDASGHKSKRSFFFSADEQKIILTGANDRSCAMAAYYLEDLLNLREGPFLQSTAPILKEALFSPRIVHSGYGKTLFTPNYLKKIAHYGFDAIALYTNREADLNFPEIFQQAEDAGLDIYFYSKFANPYHPLEKEAEAYYDQTYGGLFSRFPQAKGILFVGESIRFPSRDPQVQPLSSKTYSKPSSSSWPCNDYPLLLQTIAASIRKVAPEAELIFWTYNWGWAPEKDRVALIESLPEDICINVNFALHDITKVGRTKEGVMDYTLGTTGPSMVFTSEAAAAAKRGITLYSMANTAGKTWDFGTIPYIPAPFQWLNRFNALLEAKEKYALQGLLESHSYGWQPSVSSELAKWLFWSNSPPADEILQQLAVRESSAESAELLLSAWRHWSKGIEGFPTPIEDQYGPCRVGPSYPLLFFPDMLRTYYVKMAPYPNIDQQIVFPWYRPVEVPGMAEAAVWRVPAEIEYLLHRIAFWEQGIADFRRALETAGKKKNHSLLKELALALFIRNTLLTTRRVKQWWLLNLKLLTETDLEKSNMILQKMQEIIADEHENVEETIKLTRFDSRLGYECAMGYAGAEWHLEWKKRLLDQLSEKDIPEYQQLLEAHAQEK